MSSHLPRDKPADPEEDENKPEPIDGLAEAFDMIAVAVYSTHRPAVNDALTAFLKVAGPTLRRVIAAGLKRKRLDGPDRMLEDVGDVQNELLEKLWKSIAKRPRPDPNSKSTPDEKATGWLITMTNRLIKDLAKTPRRRYWAWQGVREFFQQRRLGNPD